MNSPAEQIERLETQIEELAASIRQSRKIMLAGQFCAAIGVIVLLLFALSSHFTGLMWLMAAVALTLGGLVLTGASKSSTDDLQRALNKAQIDRSLAIDRLALHDVSEADADMTRDENQ